MSELTVETTAIDGLLVVRQPVHGDHRGWFKEAWQREKLVALGVPDFAPVQQNMSYNHAAGATRGIHAEPWDKFVSLASGRVFSAWVDLREGPGFGTVVTLEMGIDVAVHVPRGVANSYQALEDDTTYSYLVTAHWSPDATYRHVNLFDPALGIEWPIPQEVATVSDADRAHPMLADVAPSPLRALVLGGRGQLGTALRRRLPDAVAPDRATIDLADPATIDVFDFSGYDVVINAAAFTDVDGAETPSGRALAWAVNANALAHLARAARRHDFMLVHVSSDYVFDGSRERHAEDEPPAPLGVYGQTKAAGDLAAMAAPQHLIVRPSWVVGEGKNFVATMVSLADRGVSPTVIDDVSGRLTFADDLAAAILHLVRRRETGVFHVSNTGPAMSWHDVARRVFALRGRDPDDVVPVSTQEYVGERQDVAPRPQHSTFTLDKLVATGFTPPDAQARLEEYVRRW